MGIRNLIGISYIRTLKKITGNGIKLIEKKKLEEHIIIAVNVEQTQKIA